LCKKEKEKLSPEEFDANISEIARRNAHAVANCPALLDQFADIHSEHLHKVIDFMQAENKLVVDSEGFVHIT
jgi:hypothetical protein